MLAHRLRRWASIDPTMGESPVFASQSVHPSDSLSREKQDLSVRFFGHSSLLSIFRIGKKQVGTKDETDRLW